MPDTASNANRVIATKGTSLVAKTPGPIDVCHLPILVPAPFPNMVPTTRLGAGQTVRTKIGNQPIWIAPSVVGPPSDAAHPSHAMGLLSGQPHQNVARAVTYSGDVFMEGAGAVRCTDMTTQNAANTVGLVSPAAIARLGKTLGKFKAKKCTVTKLDGVQTVMVETETGFAKKVATSRPLGWKGTDRSAPAAYLEILTGTSIEFTSTRYDLTTKSKKNPQCGKNASHTTWYVSRKGGNAKVLAGKYVGSGVTYTLDSAITDLGGLLENTTSLASKGGSKLVLSENVTRNKTRHGGKGSSGGGGAYNTTDTKRSVGTEGTIGSFGAALIYIKYINMPCVIGVAARGCAGDKVARVKLFPSQKVDVSLNFSQETATAKTKDGKGYTSQAYVQKQKAPQAIRAMIAKLKGIAAVGEKLQRFTKLVSDGPQLQLKFCVGASLGFACEYVPCTETKRGRTPAHVGLKWEASLNSNPLFEASITGVAIPLNNLLSGLFPPAAPVASALKFAGIVLEVVFACGIKLNVGGSVSRSEYNEVSGLIHAAVEPWANIELAFSARSVKIASVSLLAKGIMRINVKASRQRNVILERQFVFDVGLTLECKFLPDSRFFSKGGKWAPESLQTKYTTKYVNLLSA